MAEQQTCGQGLAENSLLPAKLGELTAVVAENLEVHREALDLNDENSKKEFGAYTRLAKELRRIAAQLQTTGEEMAGYRDLPMGVHDPKTMASPKVVNAFERLVDVEQELLALLEKWVEQHGRMLAMGRAGG